MKLFQIKYILVSFIYISLIKKSIQSIEKKRERLQNAIKFMISSIKGELKNILLSLEYQRYSILLDNFKMLMPVFPNDIQLFKEKNINNENYIIISGIKITYMMNLNIKLFSNPKILIADKFFIDTIFDDVTFHIINDYDIEFISNNISFFKIFQNNIFSKLDYFSDFNNSINNIFNGEGKNNLIKLKNIFNNSFSEKLIEIEKHINLVTYDMILIINNYTDNIISENDFLIEFNIDKITTNNNFIKLNKKDNNIKISNLTIFGKFTFYFDLDVIYNITCGDKNNHFIYERNKKNTNIEINIKDCKIELDDDLYYLDIQEDFYNIIENEYQNILMENADNYYKQVFEL